MSTGGGGGRKSVKVWKVEGKVILACFSHISINNMLKINRELSERRKIWEILPFWAYKNHRSVAVRGEARRVRPPGPASKTCIKSAIIILVDYHDFAIFLYLQKTMYF